MPDLHISNLTFPFVEFGSKKTPWDLRCLLYRGGAAVRADRVASLIDEGGLGAPLVERIGLVDKIHLELTADLASGGSKSTTESIISDVRQFFSWADQSEMELSLSTVESAYRMWCDHLMHLVRIKKNLSENTIYAHASMVGRALDKVLERPSPLARTTRLIPPRRGVRVNGIQADKQNLAETNVFGRMLLDVCNSLSNESIFGDFPVRVIFSDGRTIEHWAQIGGDKTRVRRPPRNGDEASKTRYAEKIMRKRKDAWSNDKSLKVRAPLINMRIEAELLIFVAQTGMNKAQVLNLRLRQFSYKSTTNGYEVRDYKERRAGAVLFEIYSEYREHFKSYLTWRNSIFSEDKNGLLFPFIRKTALDGEEYSFHGTKVICGKLGVSFISPGKLRNTRVNWLLRRSRSPELTAEMAQHTKETLLRVYERPSMQVAAIEITRFWTSFAPTQLAVAPGSCSQKPELNPVAPNVATPPDCVDPAGCLWCLNHHDIDTFDYVWSLASMRYLKELVRARYGNSYERNGGAVQVAVERLSQKLGWFEASNAIRRQWVLDALERVDDDTYHPHWTHMIEAIKGVPHAAG